MALLACSVSTFGSIVKTQGFGNINVIFFIGVFILANQGLEKGLLTYVSITGNSTKYVILGFLVVGAVINVDFPTWLLLPFMPQVSSG